MKNIPNKMNAGKLPELRANKSRTGGVRSQRTKKETTIKKTPNKMKAGKLPELNNSSQVHTSGSPIAPSPFADITSLILPQSFEQAQSRKLLTRLPVRKPPKTEWFRTLSTFDQHEVALIELRASMRTEYYFLSSALFADHMSALARPVILYLCQNRHESLFLWPVKTASESGGQTWTESAQAAAKLAREKWIRIVPNLPDGGYDTYEALVSLPEPEWPTLTYQEALELAFKNHFIGDTNHPVYRHLTEGA